MALIEDLAAVVEERFYCYFLMGAEEGVIFDYFSPLDLWEEAEVLFGQ